MAKANQHLRKSAKGEECTLRMFPDCVGWLENETVVLCHLPGDGIMGGKGPDWWAAYGCHVCHDIVDGRRKHNFSREDLLEGINRGARLTIAKFQAKGLMTIKGEKV